MQQSSRHLSLLAHNVRSLWNVGSFFRTGDAFSLERIYLTGYTPVPPRKDISKTALGAENVIPWEHSDDPLPLIDRLHDDGWMVVALELLPDAVDLLHYKAAEKTCLVVGHELSGIPKDLLDRCDACVRIPMLGKKESLNVAVAAGIALHGLRTSA